MLEEINKEQDEEIIIMEEEDAFLASLSTE